jgi:hypothetical protein
MIAKRVIQWLPIRSSFAKLIMGSSFVALFISLGTVGIAGLAGISVPTVLAAALAAVGAAAYAATSRDV